MKRKTFKKALAGISAAAMLVSAMPVSMIATAGDLFYSVPVTDTTPQFPDSSYADIKGANGNQVANASEIGFGAFYDALAYESFTAAGAEALDMSPLADAPAKVGYELEAKPEDFSLCYFNYRMARYADRTADKITKAATETEPAEYYSTKWDTDKAKAEILQYVEDATDVTFDTDENSANYGGIKTITMSMPYNNNGTIAYKEIEFTVIRTESELKTAIEQRYNAIILAGDLDTSKKMNTKPVYIDGNKDTGEMNINLNGYTLKTNMGITVNSATLKVWNGTVSVVDGEASQAINLFYTTSIVELYDGVTVSTSSSCNTNVITGKGQLVCCGEAKIQNGKSAQAAFLTTTGNITVVENGYAVSYTDTTNKDTALIRKVRKFNDDGVEIDATTGAYIDIDPVTKGIQYSYQPAVDATTDKEVDLASGKLTGDTTLKVSNAGQLYWVAKHINAKDLVAVKESNSGYALTIKLTDDIDMKNVGALETFAPIDAANDYALGDVTFDGDYHVISNLKAASATGSAGLFSYAGRKDPHETGVLDCAQAVTIENLGMENATVTAGSSSYASALVGEGYDVTIENSYVLNPTLTGGYTGALAGLLDGGSDLNHTYSSGKYNGLRYLQDDATKNNIKSGTDFTADGKTNFYNSEKMTETKGDTGSYMIPATDKEFTSGKVAFMLNGHNPAQTADKPTAWNSGANSGCTVNTATGYANSYVNDVFGQTLGGTEAEYPTFLELDSTVASNTDRIAVNRVFRQLSQSCDGTISAWTAVAADLKFGNEEMDYSSGHEDNGKGRCTHCGAYRIEDHFDKVLWPYLKSRTVTEYNSQGKAGANGSSAANSLDGEYINLDIIGNMTTVTIDLTKADSKKTVAEITDAINTIDKDGKCALKGFDILCRDYSSGKELANTTTKRISRVNFIVDDEVICKVYNDNDTPITGSVSDEDFADENIAEVGFRAANYPGTNGTAYTVSGLTTGAIAGTGTGLADSATPAPTLAQDVIAYDSSSKAYYVAASRTSGPEKSTRYAAFKSVPANFPDTNTTTGWYKPTLDYTFVIQFSGIKHNAKYDKDTGASDNNGWNTDASGIAATIVTIGPGANNDEDAATHKVVGKVCGCEKREDHTASYEIKNDGHKGACKICTRNYNAGHTTTDAFEPHRWEVMQVFGSLTFKRCTVCGYATITKDTNIISGTPVLSLKDGYDTETKQTVTYFRQTYDFNITAGDGEIVSYGAIVKKTPTATQYINAGKADGTISGTQYFKYDTDGKTVILNEAELKAAGLSYASRKGITTSGTYRVNINMESADDKVQIVGYVIYKDRSGVYRVLTTDLASKSFRELATVEVENSNFVAADGHAPKANDTSKERFFFTFDIAEDCTFVKYGGLLTTNKITPVTESTTTDNATYGNVSTADVIKGAEASPSAGVKSLRFAASMTVNKGDSATGRAYAIVEKYGLRWTIYSDVQRYNKSNA